MISGVNKRERGGNEAGRVRVVMINQMKFLYSFFGSSRTAPVARSHTLISLTTFSKSGEERDKKKKEKSEQVE